MAPLALIVVEVPAQVLGEVTATVGIDTTVTVTVLASVQPELLPVTL